MTNFKVSYRHLLLLLVSLPNGRVHLTLVNLILRLPTEVNSASILILVLLILFVLTGCTIKVHILRLLPIELIGDIVSENA